MEGDRGNTFEYLRRSQWLRPAVLGVIDGLVSTASLMMGVDSVKHDVKTMFLAGLAGSVAGACSMAIGEYVSVYYQYDNEVAQINTERGAEVDQVAHITRETGGEVLDRSVGWTRPNETTRDIGGEVERERLPIANPRLPIANPLQTAAVSALAVSLGAVVPLMAAIFVKEYYVRLGSVVAALTSALVVVGWLGAYLGKAPVFGSWVRVLIGGWLAMAITFSLTKLIGSLTM